MTRPSRPIAAAAAAVSLMLGGGLVGGCAQARAPHAEVGRAQKLPTEPLTIFTDRAPVRLTVEVAADPASREIGLMWRRRMGPDHGMIFDFVQPQDAAFWMRNTLIPLDMLFVAADGRILTIARQAQPHDERPVPSGGPIRAVIELNGGAADRLGIKVGDRVRDARVFPHE